MALIFENEKIWRPLTNVWTVVFLIFVVANFFSRDRYEFLITPMSILYTGILTLYVGTKEFDRWYENHLGRHPGEWFVLLWSLVIGVLLFYSFIFGGGYRVHSDVIAVYIAVLTLFAMTQKSKDLHRRKGRRRS